MASATMSKKEKRERKEELEAKRENAEFREQQKREAASQGQTSENAVPEQRPQAHQQVDPAMESKQFQEELEKGERDPMPKSAFDRAESNAQLKKAEKEERKLGPDTLAEGARVRITDGPYEGSAGAVVKVEYADFDEKQKAASGDPSIARFAKASSYMVRTRGGAHALVEVTPDQVEVIPKLGIDSSEA